MSRQARAPCTSTCALPIPEELGIGLVACSPLARGFLSGAVRSREHYAADDFRQRLAWWKPENVGTDVELVRELTELAASKGATLSQLALAWLLARKPYIVPIPGSRNPVRVADNTAAAEPALADDDLARIDQIAPNGGVGGRRREHLHGRQKAPEEGAVEVPPRAAGC
ncbi:aldo/keto reductase [Geodermatophilus sp. SYSU D01176]